jgi:nitroreductase
MNLRWWHKVWQCGSVLAACAVAVPAELPPAIALPTPDQAGGRPLMTVLKERQSIREFSARPLAPQVLSDLLWAAFGVNRPTTGHRTAPSTMNMQEIGLYVALESGLYRYEAPPHVLTPILAVDLRPKTGGQAALQLAPVVLILVADYDLMGRAKPADRDFFAAIDAGFISQNAYLYCASAGLATVVHELNRPPLAAAMRLKPEQRIVIVQAVGYPKVAQSGAMTPADGLRSGSRGAK